VLICLEERFRPPYLARPWRRDLLCVGMLAVLAALLLPVYNAGGDRYISDVAGVLVSPYLLVSLGFLLALRQGALDLSVWAVMAAAGLAAAGLIQAGFSPGWAMLAAVALGAGIGAVQGALVAGLRLPAGLVTLLMAVLIVWACGRLVAGREVSVPDSTFDQWHLRGTAAQEVHSATGEVRQELVRTDLPMIYTWIALVVGLYTATMLVLMLVDMRQVARARLHGRRALPPRVRPRLFAVLCASGALAAAGGAVWLLAVGRTPVPTRIVGDLRVCAAAVLAGGLFLGGRSRTLIAGILLPPALLVATAWQQNVLPSLLGGYDAHVLLLVGMAATVQAIWALASNPTQPRQSGLLLAATAGAGGVLLTAGTAWAPYPAWLVLGGLGIALWAAGVALAAGAEAMRAMRGAQP